ncbi:MAG: FAD-dependent oxidoreductase [Rhodospirillales bacterium]|nr:FAD-dependent oxidoreductase [Rhodospirillales bacterium]
MLETIDADLCIIGAGSGGLSVAAVASQMGASCVLIEKARMGGDCLNYGCVPSKALLAAAHAAQSVRDASHFGVVAGEPRVDAAAVRDHVRAVIASIAPNDSVERFEGLGVRVIQAEARFTGPREVAAGDFIVRARRFVIATGSGPFVPPVQGLADTPYLTNETIFDLDGLPEHLLIVGGGPIGIEMAQAYRRLGARVTVLEMGTIMPRDDQELVDVVRTRLAVEGVEILENAMVSEVSGKTGSISVVAVTNEGERRIEGSHVLVAAGRRPNTGSLGLEAAGVVHTSKGIIVDRRLRTSNRRIFAIGDVTGGAQFTHVAGYHAGIVIKNALFRVPAKTDGKAVPWVTYTDPELAHVGLTEAEAKANGQAINILRWSFADNDRASAERKTDGLIKVVTTPRGKILGASIVGPHAGELIHPWILAIANGMKVGAMATMIAPYPTLGEVGKRAAGSFYIPSFFGEKTKRLVRFLARFG